ncbi:Methionine--tRNA ligase [Candidatus Terasakiella magnetica]|nr:Methionine--tRNA ligase [Candidatus Terasakiella magnetica]
MSGAGTFYVTTPIYYVNDKPHIGHAYTTLACDVLARFKRQDGFDVKFLTGTDEHGQKVEKSAEAAGMEPKALADMNSANFRELARILGCSNDDFIRTTEPRHTQACQALWNTLVERGEIYLGHYEGWYSVRDEAFYAEDELITLPGGKKQAPTGAPVEWVKEPSYFFKLSAWQDRLLAWYDANPDCVAPASRRNEVMSFVKGGLQDLSVSRTSFKWGIPVPGDEAHVMYVWLDALTNYITALGYPDTQGDFARYWPSALHMVGKDIVRFHAVYWPALLMAAGLEPPRRVFAHGWWTNEGQKISKSVGNVIDPLTLIETYGLDQVRFFMLREVPFGNDGDYSHRAMVGRMNSELANDYGNLVQRVLSMIGKNCAGAVPQAGEASDDDRVMLGAAHGLLERLRESLDKQLFHEALEAIWLVVRAANGYVDHQAPWTLKKTDPARMNSVLWVLAETIRSLALATLPFMPSASGRILDQLAIPEEERTYAAFGPAYALKPGTALPVPQGVFPRFVEEAAP